jgi:hypothetical protein
MFAQDLYHSQLNILEMLSTYIEKTERSDTTNLQSSIFNLQYSIPACPGWDIRCKVDAAGAHPLQ